MVTQSLPTSFPPCWRDFQVYRLVKVDRCSTRHAARALQLSQTRICQILTRVGEYLGELLLASDSEVGRRKDLLVAEQLAAETMESYNRQAILAWRRSEPVTVSLPEDGDEESEPEVKRGTGNVRYLMAAAKIALYQTKLPTPKLASICPAPEYPTDDEEPDEEVVSEYDALNADLPYQFAEIQEELATNPQSAYSPDEPGMNSPPAGDCSATASSEPVAAPASAAPKVATAGFASSSISGVSAELMAKMSEARPVHSVSESFPDSPEALRAERADRKQTARKKFFGS